MPVEMSSIDLASAIELVKGRSKGTDSISREMSVNDFIREMDSVNGFLGYGYIPVKIKQVLESYRLSKGEGHVGEYLALVILELIARFEQRFYFSGLPDDFIEGYLSNFQRIVGSILAGLYKPFDIREDVFLKDLGICRQVLVPCVSHVVCRHSGIPRSIFFRRDLGEAMVLLKGLLRTGGFKPFLENHVHIAMLDDFNKEGRDQCFKLIARLLECWSDSRGLIGSSWYYDKAIQEISPNLAYLRQVPEDGGAMFIALESSQDDIYGAISRSRKRRELYERGLYQPKKTMMIWGRSKILEVYG